MADIHAAREQGVAFAAEHVAELAREINAWQDTGALNGDRLRELAGIVRPFATDHALAVAENMANRAARDALSSPGAAQTREVLRERFEQWWCENLDLDLDPLHGREFCIAWVAVQAFAAPASQPVDDLPTSGRKGTTNRMLGNIGPLCPECGETTEENNS